MKMGLFYRNKDVKNSAIGLAKRAVEYAVSFHKKFDYSKDSISDLEGILEYYHQDINQSHPADDQIRTMSLVFGAYLGESILKNGASKHGYVWKNNDGELILYKNSKYQMSPVSKVYKRLINGSEDNVTFFYEVALKIAETGKI